MPIYITIQNFYVDYVIIINVPICSELTAWRVEASHTLDTQKVGYFIHN